MKKIKYSMKAKLKCEKGISLIAMAFMILVTGGIITTGGKMYDVWGVYHDSATTNEKLDHIQLAMNQFITENGRYPCPASLNAAIDAPEYGVEVNSADCTLGGAGTFSSIGRDNKIVRTGTVPIRTLGIADTYSHDSYKHRFIYAVTEEYTALTGAPSGDGGAISVIDGNGNDATSAPGNVVQIIYSMGEDRNGAFNVNGINQQACDPSVRSGENCDFAANAIFMNTVNKSTNENNLFVHSMSYVPSKTVITCQDAAGTAPPKDTTFLIDTSTSMGWKGKGEDNFTVQCPASMPSCSRMEVAHWAMRRIMPSIIYNNSLEEEGESGDTYMTGFVENSYNTTIVENNLGDITFFDADELTEDNNNDGTPDGEDINSLIESKSVELESELQSICPSGGTPLGIHIKVLADRLGDGESTRPNKITIISDGESNNGDGEGINGKYSPIAAAKYIQTQYPNIQVDVIDIVGNDSLMKVSERTGGTYYRTDDPDALIEALYSSAGMCNNYTPPPIVDNNLCN